MPDRTFGVVKGVQVIDQTTDGLPDGFFRAAYLEHDGKRYLVLARDVGGSGVDLLTVHAEAHGSSLDELVAYARAKYASGEGVR